MQHSGLTYFSLQLLFAALVLPVKSQAEGAIPGSPEDQLNRCGTTTSYFINFNDVNGRRHNGHHFTGTFITNQYANLGAVFDSGGSPAIATSYNDLHLPTSNFLVGNSQGTGYADSYYPITMNIANPEGGGGADVVEIVLVSVGEAGLRVTALNENGETVDSHIEWGFGDGRMTRVSIQLNGVGISLVKFERIVQSIPSSDGFGIDDVRLFFSAPCP